MAEHETGKAAVRQSRFCHTIANHWRTSWIAASSIHLPGECVSCQANCI